MPMPMPMMPMPMPMPMPMRLALSVLKSLPRLLSVPVRPAKLRPLLRSGVFVLAALCAACVSRGPASLPAVEAAPDRMALLASATARTAYEQGDFATAGRLYRRGLLRAREIDDAALAADAAYNLAVAEIGLGRYDAADALLRQADYDAGRASTGRADIRLVLAKTAYLRGRPAEALALADRAAADAGPRLRLQAAILRGQIHADAGRAEAASGELRLAAALAGATRDAEQPAIAADRAKLDGSIARLEGRPDAAAASFETEASLLRAARRFRDLSRALARAAAAHAAAGRPALAADRYYLAARSLDSRNGGGDDGEAGGSDGGGSDGEAAQALLASALAAADSARDGAARARILLLKDEISRRGRP